uniref:Uncharacterized protein n=1 Tax=Haptolina brevifila TaxID=156173 RepID=A0A7S2N9P1_9EUKA
MTTEALTEDVLIVLMPHVLSGQASEVVTSARVALICHTHSGSMASANDDCLRPTKSASAPGSKVSASSYACTAAMKRLRPWRDDALRVCPFAHCGSSAMQRSASVRAAS